MKQNKIKKAKSDYTLIVGHSVAQQWDTAVILNVRAQSDTDVYFLQVRFSFMAGCYKRSN